MSCEIIRGACEKVRFAPGRTVLVAEDDHAIRGLLRDYFEDMGCRVLEAASGAEALGVAAGYGGWIDVFVTDVLMPHLSGPEAAKRLRAARPAVRVVFLSGYASDAVMALAPEGDVHHLAKPFDIDELGSLVA